MRIRALAIRIIIQFVRDKRTLALLFSSSAAYSRINEACL